MSADKSPDVGELPKLHVDDTWDEQLIWDFLWMAVQQARASGKRIPVKPRHPKQEAIAELRAVLERTAHGARLALAYLETLEKKKGWSR